MPSRLTCPRVFQYRRRSNVDDFDHIIPEQHEDIHVHPTLAVVEQDAQISFANAPIRMSGHQAGDDRPAGRLAICRNLDRPARNPTGDCKSFAV